MNSFQIKSGGDTIVLTGYQLILKELASGRPVVEQLDENIYPCGGPKPRTLTEISGNSNSGKSLLLWQIMAKCLPPRYFGGRYADVILIDCGHKFQMKNFIGYLKYIIETSNGKCAPAEMEAIVERCMSAATLIKCYSPDELTMAFQNVEDLLLQKGNVAVLLIDQLDAFYWSDAQKKLLRMSTHYARLMDKIRRLCEMHNICCAYTVDANYVEAKIQEAPINGEPNFSGSLGSQPNPPDYKISMSLLANGTRTLNEKIIRIDDRGIHFD